MLLSHLHTRDRLGIPRVFIGACAEQYLHRFNVPVHYCKHKCRNAIAVIYVYLRSMRDQQLDDTTIAALHGRDERPFSPLICYIRSGIASQEQFRVVIVPVSHCPYKSAAALPVNIGKGTPVQQFGNQHVIIAAA